jgi:CRP-like cAMP-binding protein
MPQLSVTRKTFAPNQYIFHEGDTGNDAFLVESGMVEIIQHRGDSQEVLRKVGPGDIFGAMAAIDARGRIASARAIEESVCAMIPHQLLEAKIAASDPLVVALLRWFTAKARDKASN